MQELSDPEAHLWRQGSIIPLTTRGLDIASVQLQRILQSDDCLIVISHDCDICHDDVSEEPYIEVVAARFVDAIKPDGNRVDGKSPRRLQLRISDCSNKIFDVNIVERGVVPRQLLQQTDGAFGRINRSDLFILRRWLRRRYDRTALPTVFNSRVRTAAEKVRRKLKGSGELISGVWLKIEPEHELSDAFSYEAIVYLTVKEDDFASSDNQQRIISVKTSITAAFAACEGIDILDVQIRSERDVTLADIRELIRWDYADDLSYRADADPTDLAQDG